MKYEELLKQIDAIEVGCEEDLEKIDKMLEEKNINFKSECDIAFDSCGLDVYYYAYAFMYDNEIRLITGTYDVE